MKCLQKFEKNSFIKFGILVYAFLLWLLPFIDKANFAVYEQFGQVGMAVIAFLFLIIFKDTFFLLEMVLLFMFTFSRDMLATDIPMHIFIVLGLLALGLILHLIIYRQKPKKPKFMIGLSLLCISMVLGGLLYQFDNKIQIMLLLLILSTVFLLIYLILSGSSKCTFYELSSLMSYLGLFLVLQMFVYYLMPGNAGQFLRVKMLNVGWANNGNTFSIIMLCLCPFTFFYGANNKGIKSIGIYALTILEIACIIFSFSRGAVLAAVVSYVFFVIVSLFNKEYRWKIFYFAIAALLTLCLFIIGIYFIDKTLITSLIDNLTRVNLESMNGRVPIYTKLLEEFKNQPIFGYGLFIGFYGNPEYLWAHNTFLHAAYTLGTLGFIAMVIHHLEKYVFCLKKVKYEKIVLLFSFLASDIYGFIDVSYFLPSFMLVLVVTLIMVNNSLKD